VRAAARRGICGVPSRLLDVNDQGVAMTYLIVGVDSRTLDPWHRNVMAHDAPSARRLARIRAATEGVALVVAAVIGPGSEVLAEPASVASSRAA
jgi:hypothetical protein